MSIWELGKSSVKIAVSKVCLMMREISAERLYGARALEKLAAKLFNL